MKVLLLLLHKETIKLEIPQTEFRRFQGEVIIGKSNVSVIKDVSIFRRVIRLPKNYMTDSQSISKAYESWVQRYRDLDERLNSNNLRIVDRFNRLMEQKFPGESDFIHEGEKLYLESLSEITKGADPVPIMWKKFCRKHGFHKPLDKLIVGEIVHYEILK